MESGDDLEPGGAVGGFLVRLLLAMLLVSDLLGCAWGSVSLFCGDCGGGFVVHMTLSNKMHISFTSQNSTLGFYQAQTK